MPQYIDGTTLTNSTAVYTDAGLTTCAVSGFYSDGITVREQVTTGNSCTLLPEQTCPTCATDCNSSINTNLQIAVFTISLNVGSATGAVILTLDPSTLPDGMMATYNGQVFNKFSSPNYGLRQSGTASEVTYIGINNICLAAGTVVGVDKYSYLNSAWSANGTQDVTLVANQIQTSPAAVGACVMVVPKPTPTPTTVEIQVVSLCGSPTDWSSVLSCPAILTGVASNASPAATAILACDSAYNSVHYHVPVNASSSAGNVFLHDYLFTDSSGSTPLSDGWYLIPNGSTVEITSGIVTDTADTCETWTIEDCLDSSLHTVLKGSYGFVVGNVIQYETMVPATGPDGINRCGTILSGGTGVNTDAVVADPAIRACDDTLHCPS
jgi:hypothetical protein|tara:strand:+ start:2143 stop:3285 length:1143 start_codon:yes stop_codon:yes gene_type:complete